MEQGRQPSLSTSYRQTVLYKYPSKEIKGTKITHILYRYHSSSIGKVASLTLLKAIFHRSEHQLLATQSNHTARAAALAEYRQAPETDLVIIIHAISTFKVLLEEFCSVKISTNTVSSLTPFWGAWMELLV